VTRARAVALAAALAAALVGCGGGGGAPKSPPPSPPPGAAATAEGACLAIAGAKRERRASEPARVTVRHVLVKYAGAKNAPAFVTRSREAACDRAAEARKKLEGGASFADVVKEYSDEAGAATREGLVGTVERGDVAPAFADAAFELAPGEVSHVVETPFGFHVILRAP
jgi:hypothetical protein